MMTPEQTEMAEALAAEMFQASQAFRRFLAALAEATPNMAFALREFLAEASATLTSEAGHWGAEIVRPALEAGWPADVARDIQ